MSEEIRLSQRRVDVERLAQDVVIDAGRDPSYQDGVLVIPIHEEVPLTALRLVPNELVQVRQVDEAELVPVVVESRREVVNIERPDEA